MHTRHLTLILEIFSEKLCISAVYGLKGIKKTSFAMKTGALGENKQYEVFSMFYCRNLLECFAIKLCKMYLQATGSLIQFYLQVWQLFPEILSPSQFHAKGMMTYQNIRTAESPCTAHERD